LARTNPKEPTSEQVKRKKMMMKLKRLIFLMHLFNHRKRKMMKRLKKQSQMMVKK
jgi:hypothetical protein